LLNQFTYGGFFDIMPGSVTNVYGINKGTQIFSIILTAQIPSSLLNFLMTEFILPNFGFLPCFLICAAMTVMAMIILWRFEEELDVDNLSKVQGIDLKYKSKEVEDD